MGGPLLHAPFHQAPFSPPRCVLQDQAGEKGPEAAPFKANAALRDLIRFDAQIDRGPNHNTPPFA